MHQISEVGCLLRGNQDVVGETFRFFEPTPAGFSSWSPAPPLTATVPSGAGRGQAATLPLVPGRAVG